MPDARLEQTRKTLPEGYQFGDGRFATLRELAAAHFIDRWHARHTVGPDDQLAQQRLQQDYCPS